MVLLLILGRHLVDVYIRYINLILNLSSSYDRLRKSSILKEIFRWSPTIFSFLRNLVPATILTKRIENNYNMFKSSNQNPTFGTKVRKEEGGLDPKNFSLKMIVVSNQYKTPSAQRSISFLLVHSR